MIVLLLLVGIVLPVTDFMLGGLLVTFIWNSFLTLALYLSTLSLQGGVGIWLIARILLWNKQPKDLPEDVTDADRLAMQLKDSIMSILANLVVLVLILIISLFF